MPEQSPDRIAPPPATPRPSHVHVVTAALIGDPAATDLDRRVLNGLMFLAAVTGIASTLQNVIIGTSLVMVAATVALTIVGVLGYLAARRTEHPYRLKMALFAFFLALLVFCWFTQAGSQGTVGYYFVLLACYAVLLFGGTSKLITLALTAATLGTLLVIEHYYPSLIVPHANRLERFADVAMALPLCLAMAAAIIHLVHREYQRERRAKDRVLDMVTTEKNRAEQAMRDKQRLLSVVSHDIANALQVLQAEIDIAHLPPRAGHPPPAADLDQMAYACTKIEEIIGSVRMMEGLEQQQCSLSTRPVDLSAMFEYAEVIFGKRMSRRRMRFEFPNVSDGTRFVMAEPRILANQVFGNLISNAIKFSYPSSTIAFSVTQLADQTTIRVIDRGIGIPPELMEDLFSTQTIATRKGTEGERGTGFGLRTVKHFVDLFGGQMEITSRPEQDYPDDHGTTVTVHLKSAAAPVS